MTTSTRRCAACATGAARRRVARRHARRRRVAATPRRGARAAHRHPRLAASPRGPARRRGRRVNRPVDAAAAWIYRGVWASVVALFRVPAGPADAAGRGRGRCDRSGRRPATCGISSSCSGCVHPRRHPAAHRLERSVARRSPVLGLALAAPFSSRSSRPTSSPTSPSTALRHDVVRAHRSQPAHPTRHLSSTRPRSASRTFRTSRCARARCSATSASPTWWCRPPAAGSPATARAPDVVARRAHRHPAGSRRRRGGAQPDPRQRRADAIGGPRRRASACTSRPAAAAGSGLSERHLERAARDPRQRPPSRAVVTTESCSVSKGLSLYGVSLRFASVVTRQRRGRRAVCHSYSSATSTSTGRLRASSAGS